MDVTINGYEAVITVDSDNLATEIVFPNLYTQPDQPVSLTFQPAVPVSAAEAAAQALLNALGYNG